MRRCTHVSPIFRHSSQPFVFGFTPFLIVPACVHCAAISSPRPLIVHILIVRIMCACGHPHACSSEKRSYFPGLTKSHCRLAFVFLVPFLLVPWSLLLSLPGPTQSVRHVARCNRPFHPPRREVDLCHFIASCARDIRGLAVWPHQHFLRAFAHV